MKHKKQVHMVGNAHIDPVWLWQWQEGFQEIKATFRSALDRMNEYDEWIFTCSSAAFYEWVEQNDPAIFNEVRSRVAEGRWVLAGGWWVQSDCNLPCGESFVRQALLGQRYFVRTFGKIARTGYNVDSFGHHGMLPQILQKSGCDNYVFMRPMPSEKALPARVFHWQSSDGSSVKAFRIPYEYCTWPKELSQHIERCANEIADPINDVMCFFGVFHP
jgi:alpha-mannosidase